LAASASLRILWQVGGNSDIEIARHQAWLQNQARRQQQRRISDAGGRNSGIGASVALASSVKSRNRKLERKAKISASKNQ